MTDDRADHAQTRLDDGRQDPLGEIGGVAGLLSAIGHELRNTVGAVVHQIELLSGPELDPSTAARSRRSIVDTAGEMNRFIDALTDLERLQRRRFPADRVAVELHAVLRSIVAHPDLVDGELGDGELGDGELGDGELGDALVGHAVHIATGEPVDVLVEPQSMRRVLTILIGECEMRLGGFTIHVLPHEDRPAGPTERHDPRAERVQVRFGVPGADPQSHRPVSIDDGVALWTAARLAALSDARLETNATWSSLCLTLWLVPADDTVNSTGRRGRMTS